LRWFVTEFVLLCDLLLPLVPPELPLAHCIREAKAACAPTLNPHCNLRRLRVLRSLWTVSVMVTSLIRRELRILAAVMRGICLLTREAALLHTSSFALLRGSLWWRVYFPRPSLFAEAWQEAATRHPFPAADTPVKINYHFVPDHDYSDFIPLSPGTPSLAQALHRHWQHHANWPAHGHMLALHQYWDSIFAIDDETMGPVHPLTCHRIGVEARMLVLIIGAPPEFWFSELPYQRLETLDQDEAVPEEDDSWLPWTDPPLPPSPFLLPYRPGNFFYTEPAERRLPAYRLLPHGCWVGG
jgi:hypothetical protein